ncbi:hypothetical protein LR48_Vigan07g135600 [Vigna angularis]|uniref:Uncharacterized protein n=1 Tax=Phaseolus angularis TaxID=3914 RepID=A0A0L9UYJ5_PHAAN|nr:hypothetical protein LR48_Vigan07g135600 [Vigna angularis]
MLGGRVSTEGYYVYIYLLMGVGKNDLHLLKGAGGFWVRLVTLNKRYLGGNRVD